jgi:hypothetical protein
VADGFQYTLPAVAFLVAVTQFNGFTRTGRGAGRHRGTAHGAAGQRYFRLYRGISPGVQYFPPSHFHNLRHCFLHQSAIRNMRLVFIHIEETHRKGAKNAKLYIFCYLVIEEFLCALCVEQFVQP